MKKKDIEELLEDNIAHLYQALPNNINLSIGLILGKIPKSMNDLDINVTDKAGKGIDQYLACFLHVSKREKKVWEKIALVIEYPRSQGK